MQKLKRAKRYIDEVSRETGWTRAQAAARMLRAKRDHGIGLRRYAEERLYLVPQDRLSEHRVKRNDQIAFVAKQRGIGYEDAREVMDRARDEYGVSYREFVRRNLWKFKTEADLDKRLERIRTQDRRFVDEVCNETGWSFEEAERKMLETKKRWPAVTFRKYAAFNFHGMTDDEIDARVRQWIETSSENRRRVMQESGWTAEQVRAHMTRFEAEYGVIPAYYMCFRGWELSDEQIESYATVAHSQRLSTAYNDRADLAMARDKERFDEVFRDFLNRRFWSNAEGATFESFSEFAQGLDAIFCKLLRSGGGVGAFKVELPGDEAGLRRVYDDLMAKPRMLVEEVLQQHPEMAEFYPGSINTIRVVMIEDEGRIRIISTGIQFGHREVTDNFTNDGMVCAVDTDSGTVLTPAVDKDGAVYETHPVSGKRFEGFRVPNWDLVLDTAKRAMGVREGLRYVGWDIAIQNDKVSILEANTVPDPVLLQAAYAPQKEGKRYLYDPFLQKI
ncbi:sugar-transfer associated ATP-grasp domain-containing protein [Leucobacter tenebrionis]|uniref:sugar-transfer associated ATP-grasp domain-containing protein n=1 Tax=Leucobacter tenebrionis TaxID=2873270 RepID=UPI001CA7254A|nr:sugar-transfer associated ATP-grasp domain-containing protein [Leucobacter tenebrionis]QZY53118.1 hypothetical protein KVY00_06765 [Leucobacter tenebrionis]